MINTKEKYDLQIKSGLIDMYTFLEVFPYIFCDLDRTNGKVKATTLQKRLNRLNNYIYNNRDFPAFRLGGVILIDLEKLKAWLLKKKQKESSYDVVISVSGEQ